MGRQVVDARVEVEGGVAHSPRVPGVLAFAVKLLSVLFSKPGMVSNAMFCSFCSRTTEFSTLHTNLVKLFTDLEDGHIKTQWE